MIAGFGAAEDLGLGGALRQQVGESEDEKRKRLMREAQAQQTGTGNPLHAATDTLFGV